MDVSIWSKYLVFRSFRIFCDALFIDLERLNIMFCAIFLFCLLLAKEQLPSQPLAKGELFLKVNYECRMHKEKAKKKYQSMSTVLPSSYAQKLFSFETSTHVQSLYVSPSSGWAVFDFIQVDEAGDTLSTDLFYQEKEDQLVYAVLLKNLRLEKVQAIPVYPPGHAFDWEIYEEESKEVCGFICRKAVLNFGEEQYPVWFAPDVPLPFGPYRYMGLPGLILEMEGPLYYFRAVSIEQVEEIPFPRPKDVQMMAVPVRRN